jgi:hypothetical protein
MVGFLTNPAFSWLQYKHNSKLLLQIPAALELEKCIFQQSIKLSLVAATQTRGL